MILKQGERITGQLEEDYHSLERVLKEMAKERGWSYRVKDWETVYECIPLRDDEKPAFSNFAGYKMVKGLFIPQTVLLATFGKPEHYLLSPSGAPKDYQFLAINHDPTCFSREMLRERMQAVFPHRDFHFDRY